MRQVVNCCCIFFFILGLSSVSISQNATIKGFIYTKDNGEPSIFTTVYLKGTKYGGSTDLNGYFTISNIPPGSYALTVAILGYDTIVVPVELHRNELISKKLFLIKSLIELTSVEISGVTESKKTDPTVSVYNITPKEVNRIPSVGGEPDIAQYLQVLPGVISTGDQGGQLYIRGGSPVQNEVIQDGMLIYNPFHSIGLFSVFDMDIINSATIYAGGFGAQYGGRISSVMNFTTKDGNKKRISGKVSIGPFVAHALLEGPIFNSKSESGGSGTYIVSAKTSLLPETSRFLYTYANPNGLPFYFTDLYGKVSFSSTSGSKINFFAMHSDDEVTYQNISSFKWTSNGFGSNFVVIPAGSSTLIEGNFALTNYSAGMSSATFSYPSLSSISSFNFGTKLTYFLDHKNSFTYGVQVVGVGTTFDFYNATGEEINDPGNSTEFGAYASYKYVSPDEKLIIEPSFRAQYYSSLAAFSPEPRVDGKYNITSKIRFKFAGGWYTQNLISATNSQDVVNLFYGFITSPTNLSSNFTNENGTTSTVNAAIEKANHIIGGFEFDLPKRLGLTVEAYRKNLTQLIEVNPYKIYPDNNDPSIAGKPDYLKKDFIVEDGVAQGIDFTLKYDYKRFYLWTTYSLAKVQIWDGVQEYYPIYDRRNTINIAGSYEMGKSRDWDFNIRWNFGSGFPFTPTQGFYENINLTNVNSSYTTANGTLGILYGSLDSKRLPDYHRLDISIKHRIELKENMTFEISAGATNVYNRDNIFYFDRVTYTRVNQLPIMPSVTLSLKF